MLWNGWKLGASPNFGVSDSPVILLGLGFTTSRLARKLLPDGHGSSESATYRAATVRERYRNLRTAPIFAVARNIVRYEHLAAQGLHLHEFVPPAVPADLPKAAVLVHTIPPLAGAEQQNLRAFIQALEPRRVLYISSTSVYGEQTVVTEQTHAAPNDPKGLHRMEEEAWLTQNPWQTFIIRPAAIYGPGRGVHERIREGKPPRAAGTTIVSRIHADDLAAILAGAIDSNLEGAWPLADELPCSTDAITDWCAKLLQMPVQRSENAVQIAGRTVDGRKIRELLGVQLLYPGYPEGIPACLAEAVNSPRID